MNPVGVYERLTALLDRECCGDESPVETGAERGPFIEYRFVVAEVVVYLLCSEWETIAFIDDVIRWEIGPVEEDEALIDLAKLVRALRGGCLTRSEKRVSLTLEDGERLSG